jgi:hypothetical protein
MVVAALIRAVWMSNRVSCDITRLLYTEVCFIDEFFHRLGRIDTCKGDVEAQWSGHFDDFCGSNVSKSYSTDAAMGHQTPNEQIER